MSEENGSEAALLDQIQLLSSEALDSEEVANEEHVEHEEQAFEDPGTPLENEYSAEVEEDSEDEDDFKIIIDDTRTNVTFRAPGGVQRGAVVGGVGKTTQKLDIDATAMINGAPLYDLDLASLEEKPWRKPGADVTDYFNYGFTEDTWQMYCERHRKLRAEFGPLTNRQMFSQLSGIAQSIPMNVEKIAPKYTSASIQQQIPTMPSVINNLVLPANTMLSQQQHPQLIMRTVLTVPPANASSSQAITAVVTTPAVPAPTPQPVPTLTSSVPHPQNAALVQQTQHIPSLQQQSNMLSQSPPDSPGSTPPPSSSGSMQPHPDVPGSGATAGENVHFPDLSMPPPRFHSTNVPPPTFPVPGLPPTNVPPPMFGHPPPPGVPLRFPPPFGFPPPSRPRIQSIRHSYRVGFPPNFESTPRDDARSPASYSDKSSDEEDRDRYDRHRRHAPSERYRRSSRSPSSSTRSRYSGRDRDRERSSHRGSRYRSRSPLDRSHHGSSSHDDRKDSRDKRRKSEEDDSHKKIKKRKIKDEPMDEEDLLEKSREKSSKKSKEKEDKDKDRSSSSSSKKRKKSKERQDTEHHAEEDSQKT